MHGFNTSLLAKISPPSGTNNSNTDSVDANKFFDLIDQQLKEHLCLTKLKCLAITSSSNINKSFASYFIKSCALNKDTTVKSKIAIVDIENGDKDIMQQVLSNELVILKLKSTSSANESSVMSELMQHIAKNTDKAAYGKQHIKYALSCAAIDTLLMADTMYRYMHYHKLLMQDHQI